jgi:selenocysteine-specific elongation factor
VGEWSAREGVLHLGSAAAGVRVRALGAGTARLTLRAPLPLHVGDRALLRDPGSRAVVGVTVLDVAPPALRRRGAAAARGAELAGRVPDAAAILARAGVLRRGELVAMGLAAPPPVVDDWLADPAHWALLAARLTVLVTEYAAARPLEAGLPVDAARAALGLPDRRLVTALAGGAALRVDAGRVLGAASSPPPEVARAVTAVRAELAAAPFRAPVADRLGELGLTPAVLAAAARAGTLLKIADGIVLAPEAVALATAVLSELAQPFTVSEARRALDTSRRVAIPLLEYLDRHDVTLRLDDGRRRLGP